MDATSTYLLRSSLRTATIDRSGPSDVKIVLAGVTGAMLGLHGFVIADDSSASYSKGVTGMGDASSSCLQAAGGSKLAVGKFDGTVDTDEFGGTFQVTLVNAVGFPDKGREILPGSYVKYIKLI